MSEDCPIAKPQDEPLVEASTTAEEKRRAARRRFLGRSAAAGSGLVIVTLVHTRAFAWGTTNTDQHLVSSIEACKSWGGKGAYLETKDTWGGGYKLYDSPSGKQRYNCIKY